MNQMYPIIVRRSERRIEDGNQMSCRGMNTECPSERWNLRLFFSLLSYLSSGDALRDHAKAFVAHFSKSTKRIVFRSISCIVVIEVHNVPRWSTMPHHHHHRHRHIYPSHASKRPTSSTHFCPPPRSTQRESELDTPLGLLCTSSDCAGQCKRCCPPSLGYFLQLINSRGWPSSKTNQPR